MPESAIEYVDVDHVLNASEVAPILVNERMHPGKKPMATRAKTRVLKKSGRPRRLDAAEVGTDLLGKRERPATPPSVFVCPGCGGPLWETDERGLLRYHCHVGHAYTAEALLSAQTEALEQAMWTALRSLEEAAALRERMAEHARSRGMHEIADQYDNQSEDYAARAGIVRKALVIDRATPDADKPAARVAERARKVAEK